MSNGDAPEDPDEEPPQQSSLKHADETNSVAFISAEFWGLWLMFLMILLSKVFNNRLCLLVLWPDVVYSCSRHSEALGNDSIAVLVRL